MVKCTPQCPHGGARAVVPSRGPKGDRHFQYGELNTIKTIINFRLSPQQLFVLLLRRGKVRRSVGQQLFQVGLRPLGRAPAPPRLSDRRRYRWDEGERSSYLSGAGDKDTGSDGGARRGRLSGTNAQLTILQLVKNDYCTC